MFVGNYLDRDCFMIFFGKNMNLCQNQEVLQMWKGKVI